MLQTAWGFAKFTASNLISDIRNARVKADRHGASDACKHARTLVREGVVMIPQFIDADQCHEWSQRILDLSARFDRTTLTDEQTLIEFRGAHNKDRAYVGGHKAIDQNMIDVHDVDRPFPDLAMVRDAPIIAQIIQAASRIQLAAASLHAYINQSTTQTRGFHLDSTSPQFKAFVYLTDVIEPEHGPYAFVPRSHRFTAAKYRYIMRNWRHGLIKTEMGAIHGHSELTALGGKGTLIISNQNGFHRGLPQAPGRVRVLLSVDFRRV